jgi:type III secretion system FlhB-like substrate exporter
MAEDRGERAAALRYTEELPAPIVVAAGRGALARAIKRIAEESGVTLVADRQLVDTLVALEVGSLIPEELYQPIAEILVFVRNLRADR